MTRQIQDDDARLDNIVQLEDGRFIATQDNFLNDGNFNYVAILDHQQWLVSEKIYLQVEEKRKKLIEEMAFEPVKQERYYQERLYGILLIQGYACEREKKTEYGIIDIYCREPESIIEVKLTSCVSDVAQAISQLARYSITYPNAKLYFYCPEKTNNATEKLLERFGIGIWK